MLSEGEVVAVGVCTSYTGAEADGGDVAGTGYVDVELRGFDVQPAGLYFRAQGEGGTVHIALGRQRRQHVFIAERGDVEVHFLFAAQFEELFQLQFVILQGGLCGYQLIFVGTDLRFQLGKVAFGDASRCEQGARPFTFRLAHVEGGLVYFDGFGGIEYLHVNLRDAFLNAVFTFRYVQFGDAVVHSLLL